jgi:hypothetical protein
VISRTNEESKALDAPGKRAVQEEDKASDNIPLLVVSILLMIVLSVLFAFLNRGR